MLHAYTSRAYPTCTAAISKRTAKEVVSVQKSGDLLQLSLVRKCALRQGERDAAVHRGRSLGGMDGQIAVFADKVINQII